MGYSDCGQWPVASGISWLILLLFFVPFSLFGAPNSQRHDLNPDLLIELQRMWGADEAYVIERLTREAEARRLYPMLRQELDKSWGGGWIDGQSMTLVVGTTDPGSLDMAEHFGARSKIVDYSLYELEHAMHHVGELRNASIDLERAIVGWGIDPLRNRVVVSVLESFTAQVRHQFDYSVNYAEMLEIETVSRVPALTSSIRGGNCFQNNHETDYDDNPIQCSIGFSVDVGFITAGHCAREIQSINVCNSSASLGMVQHSDWPNRDNALVSTPSPWSPVAEVNGYSHGVLDVSAINAGIEESLVGSAVCRYGVATGARCGEIVAKNQTRTLCTQFLPWAGGLTCVEQVQLTGLTETDACVDFTDSGGPFITADGQAQGITVGGNVDIYNPGYNCSDPFEPNKTSWFQPIRPVVHDHDLVLLSAHGPNAPTIHGFSCPNAFQSGEGMYVCDISHFLGQGTEVQWTGSTGHSASNMNLLVGFCASHQTVNVNLTVSSPYGSDQRNAQFTCPTGPIP